MTVSVVVLHYGDETVTQKCLARLFGCEVILVDNQPTRRTADTLYNLSRLTVRNRDNKGFAYGCNQGAALSTGDVIVFLNNDTEPRAGWLAPLADAATKYGVAGPKLIYPDGRIQHAGVRIFVDNGVLTAENMGRGEPDTGQYDTAQPVDAVTGACLAIDRRKFFEVGGFDTRFWNGYEDVDLCIRAGGAYYEPDSEVLHHESASGPERWSRVRENVGLLNERWLGRYVDE